MLNIGGIKIPPIPHESALRLIEGVNDCVLLSDHELFGVEQMVACVECPGEEKAMRNSIETYLTPHFNNFEIHLFATFPRTESGKVIRSVLKNMVSER